MGGADEVEALPNADGVSLARALAESEERFRLAFDAVTDSLVLFSPVFDADGEFLDAEIKWMNRAARVRWFDAASLEDMRGVELFKLAPMFRAPVFEIFRGVARDSTEFKGVISMEHPTEGRVYLDLHITPFEGGFVYTSRDVTAQHLAEQSLRRRVEQLDALRRISQLLAESRDPREVLDGVAGEIGILLAARCVRIHVVHVDAGDDGLGITSGSTGCPEFIDPEADMIHAAMSGGRSVTTMPAGHVAHHHLAVPMVAGSRSVGTLIVGRDDVAFSDEEVAVAGTVTDLLAAAVQNAQLHAIDKLRAASNERQRLARDLHDAVTQSIYSASLISAALPAVWERSPEEGMENLRTLRLLVRAALAELRSLLYELRPASLEAAPLNVLLERLGDSLKGRSNNRLEIEVPADLRLPPDVKLAFYRVAQEALNNVGKHAQSTVAGVTVTQNGDEVRLVIRDDGWGFDPARRRRATDQTEDSFGLGIMRSRAEEIGATLQVDSVPGLGTTVEMIWRQLGAHDAPYDMDGGSDG